MNSRSERIWEWAGITVAMVACGAIASQLIVEWRTPERGSLSMISLLGFTLVFAFWTVYGWNFKRPAIWMGNSIAATLQLLLLTTCLWKMWHEG